MNGRHAQIRHRLLEGFLLRLGRQPDAEAFVVRGGMLVRNWLPEERRPALDVDLACRLPYDAAAVRERLAAILAEPRGERRPARTSLMTGLPVSQHGIHRNLRPPDPRLPSHVRALRGAGYHTALVGKSHLHAGRGHLDAHRERLHAWGFADVLELPDPQQHHLRSGHSDWLVATTAAGE